MEAVVLKNIAEDAQEITLELELAQKVQQCPACGATTSRVHDYHHRTIRDLDLAARERRSNTGVGATSALNVGKSSPRNAASPGVISASPIG